MKTCYYCKVEKSLTLFNKNGIRNGKIRYKPFCKECESKVVKENQRKILRKAYTITHNLPYECSLCGYSKCEAALEFHHLNPSEKEFDIKALTNCSVEKAVNEIQKCILVCANCHRELHNGAADPTRTGNN